MHVSKVSPCSMLCLHSHKVTHFITHPEMTICYNFLRQVKYHSNIIYCPITGVHITPLLGYTLPHQLLGYILPHYWGICITEVPIETPYRIMLTPLMMFPVMRAKWNNSIRDSEDMTSSMAVSMVVIAGLISAIFSSNSSLNCMASMRTGYLQAIRCDL